MSQRRAASIPSASLIGKIGREVSSASRRMNRRIASNSGSLHLRVAVTSDLHGNREVARSRSDRDRVTCRIGCDRRSRMPPCDADGGATLATEKRRKRLIYASSEIGTCAPAKPCLGAGSLCFTVARSGRIRLATLGRYVRGGEVRHHDVHRSGGCDAFLRRRSSRERHRRSTNEFRSKYMNRESD